MSISAFPPAPSPAGIHYLLELQGCDRDITDDAERLEQTLVSCAREAGATVVQSYMHHFSPHGLSGVVIIAESHLAVHTWPEHDYVSLDIYTCGEAQIAEQIYQELVSALRPAVHTSQCLTRVPPNTTR